MLWIFSAIWGLLLSYFSNVGWIDETPEEGVDSMDHLEVFYYEE